ncbi:MAG: HAD family hydrolase [Lachnospiraceae bacterium]|nr:HAD family hydrolase [Lachnospiraceae bacterium]
MKKGIIFDVDGTLWDACAVVAESWNEYLEQYEKDVPVRISEEDMRSVMGLTMSDIGDALFGMLQKQRRLEIVEGCCTYEVEYMKNRGGILYPDLETVFAKLSENYHLYIVSNCQKGYIEDFLSWSGMDRYVEDFESYGRTGQAKGYNIRLLRERNRLDQAVYVGDTQGDYNSTCEAGLPFIHAGYGFGKVEAEVPSISGLKELPELVQRIFRDPA